MVRHIVTNRTPNKTISDLETKKTKVKSFSKTIPHCRVEKWVNCRTF